jgi:hypothetical protein
VSVQSRRHELAVILTEWMEEDGWVVTEKTRPDLGSLTVAVGHARTIDPDSYRTYQAVLVVTLWVNEGDDADAVDELYARLSPGDKSIIQFLNDHPTFKLTGSVTAGNVGPRDEGPTGYLAATVLVPTKVS